MKKIKKFLHKIYPTIVVIMSYHAYPAHSFCPTPFCLNIPPAPFVLHRFARIFCLFLPSYAALLAYPRLFLPSCAALLAYPRLFLPSYAALLAYPRLFLPSYAATFDLTRPFLTRPFLTTPHRLRACEQEVGGLTRRSVARWSVARHCVVGLGRRRSRAGYA